MEDVSAGMDTEEVLITVAASSTVLKVTSSFRVSVRYVHPTETTLLRLKDVYALRIPI